MTGGDGGREAGQWSAWLRSDEFCGVWKHFPAVKNKSFGAKGQQADDIAWAGATKDGFDSFQSGGSAAVNEG